MFFAALKINPGVILEYDEMNGFTAKNAI